MYTPHSSSDPTLLSESAHFFATHYPDLQREYGGRWIAVQGRSVRLVGDDLIQLNDEIQRTCPHETLVVDFIPMPGEELDWK